MSTEKSVKNKNNPYNGKRETPAGVLAPDHAKRHNLTKFMFESGDRSFRSSHRHDRRIKKIFENVKTYRTLAHNVNESRLSESLRLSVHYMLEPLSKGMPVGPMVVRNNDNDDTIKSVQSPMKV